ncbi:TIGR04255 family protein [Rhizobium sp. YTU87027]|uniref:TIGR04255 family protein n=1 Tax=Rhizobium sp. YTU87027 TaxID=3417741 RepID=UPI003D68813E
MAEFRTQIPAHAIERCTASIIFNPSVPDKAFERIVAQSASQLMSSGFRSTGPSVGLSVDVVTGRVIHSAEGAPKLYIGPDGQTQVTVMPNLIALSTPQYVRWAHFHNLIEKILRPLCDAYNNIVSINAVKLEYWDRFLWTGSWSDFDVDQLLDVSSGVISQKAMQAEREWHSHCGWFEFLGPSKRLVNVNADVVEVRENGVTPLPSIGIYTMMQDQVFTPEHQANFEAVSASKKFDELHVGLKNLFASLILKSYATRIGLLGEKKNA